MNQFSERNINLNVNEIVNNGKDEDGFLKDLGDEMKYYIIKSWTMEKILDIFLLNDSPKNPMYIKNERNKQIFSYMLKNLSATNINGEKEREKFLKYINK